MSLTRHGLCFLKQSFQEDVIILKFLITLQRVTTCKTISHIALCLSFFTLLCKVLENSGDIFLPYLFWMCLHIISPGSFYSEHSDYTVPRVWQRADIYRRKPVFSKERREEKQGPT